MATYPELREAMWKRLYKVAPTEAEIKAFDGEQMIEFKARRDVVNFELEWRPKLKLLAERGLGTQESFLLFVASYMGDLSNRSVDPDYKEVLRLQKEILPHLIKEIMENESWKD